MAVPGKVGRVIAAVLVIAVIALGVILGFNPFGSNVPEGVDTDATEVRSVTLSDGTYEVLDYNDVLYELVPNNTEVNMLEDSSREFISRDRNTLWVKEDTAEKIGL